MRVITRIATARPHRKIYGEINREVKWNANIQPVSRVTAKVGYKFHNIYRGKGPVLTAVSVEPAEKPLEDVVTFS